jgi:hypothetical protein
METAPSTLEISSGDDVQHRGMFPEPLRLPLDGPLLTAVNTGPGSGQRRQSGCRNFPLTQGAVSHIDIIPCVLCRCTPRFVPSGHFWEQTGAFQGFLEQKQALLSASRRLEKAQKIGRHFLDGREGSTCCYDPPVAWGLSDAFCSFVAEISELQGPSSPESWTTSPSTMFS